jgi:hypothetical protein
LDQPGLHSAVDYNLMLAGFEGVEFDGVVVAA